MLTTRKSKKLHDAVSVLLNDYGDFEYFDKVLFLDDDHDFCFEHISNLIYQSQSAAKPINIVSVFGGNYYFLGDEEDILADITERIDKVKSLKEQQNSLKKDELLEYEETIKNIKAKLTKEELMFILFTRKVNI